MSRFPTLPPKTGPGATLAPGGLVMRANRPLIELTGESLAQENGLVRASKRPAARSRLIPDGSEPRASDIEPQRY